MHLQRSMSQTLQEALLPLTELCESGPSLNRIQEETAHSVREVVEDLLEMALIPRVIAREFSIDNPPAVVKPPPRASVSLIALFDHDIRSTSPCSAESGLSHG